MCVCVCVCVNSFSSLLVYLAIHTFVCLVIYVIKAVESSKSVCVWLSFFSFFFTASVLYCHPG